MAISSSSLLVTMSQVTGFCCGGVCPYPSMGAHAEAGSGEEHEEATTSTKKIEVQEKEAATMLDSVAKAAEKAASAAIEKYHSADSR